MAKTFEALMKAEEESQKRRDKIIAFEPKPDARKPWTGGDERRFKIYRLTWEQCGQIKYNILRSTSEKNIRTLLFSSPTRGEGNSTVLINFAMSLTLEGERVLLVDSNLRNPSLHQVFNLEKENGFAELILGKVNLKDVIKETLFDNLFVITCGMDHFSPSSVFKSNSLNNHIEEMKTQADWIIFDGPQINSYDDPIRLASKVDGVVMVVEAEKTRWEVAQLAKQRIENGKGKILGVVLNKRQFHIPDWLYKRL
jgi:capsular exopolysaccharide synthesis family protein